MKLLTLFTATIICGTLLMPGCKGIDVPPADGDSPNTRMKEAYELSLKAQEAQKQGRTAEAIDYYQRSAALQPNLRGVWNNLGVLLMQQQMYLNAAEAFKRESDLAPDDPRPLENLGLVYFNAGFADQAMTQYFRALERDPNWVPALRGIALSSRRLVQADQKIADVLRRALLVETDPEWRKIFEQERLRVENQLREQNDSERGDYKSTPVRRSESSGSAPSALAFSDSRLAGDTSRAAKDAR